MASACGANSDTRGVTALATCVKSGTSRSRNFAHEWTSRLRDWALHSGTSEAARASKASSKARRPLSCSNFVQAWSNCVSTGAVRSPATSSARPASASTASAPPSPGHWRRARALRARPREVGSNSCSDRGSARPKVSALSRPSWRQSTALRALSRVAMSWARKSKELCKSQSDNTSHKRGVRIRKCAKALATRRRSTWVSSWGLRSTSSAMSSKRRSSRMLSLA
mmetsp:Transcript_104256/g.270251  ORF Transcript_104256/g.270251 Transcript_104256/m.270251 type:complete len:225 (-) Transcript_104256:619-1293(-)